jgi:hypothetical protein
MHVSRKVRNYSGDVALSLTLERCERWADVFEETTNESI